MINSNLKSRITEIITQYSTSPKKCIQEVEHLFDEYEALKIEKEKEFEKSQNEKSVLEKTLRNKTDLFMAITNNMTDMLWAKDNNNAYLFCNKSFCENFLNAKDSTEPIGKKDMFFAQRERDLHPQDPDWHTFGEVCRDTDQVVLENKRHQQFDEYGNIKGKFLFLDVHKSPMYNNKGKIIGTVGSGRDVTKEKRIEEELKKSELRFRNVLENVELIALMLNKSGTIVFANDYWVNISGYTKDEIIGSNWFERFTIDETKQRTKEIFNKTIYKEGFPKSYINEIIIRGGQKRTIKWSNTSHINQKTKEITITCIGEDITSRLKNEDELLRLNNMLTEKNAKYITLNKQLIKSLSHIQKMNKDLEKSKEKAEESDRLKTYFLANMSHEIRTPMNSIMGFASLLSQEEDKKHLFKYSKIIENSSEQLVRMIDDIVLYSKLQTKLFTYLPVKFAISDLLDDIKQSFLINDFKKNIHLEVCKTNCTSIVIESDYQKLQQLIINLVKNAFKYTFDGSITIGCRTRTDYIDFFVEDTGIGIPENEIEKVFERFYRGSNIDKSNIGGTGLGLSIVKELIKLLRGRIKIHSQLGKGTHIDISIPRTVES